MNLQTPLPGLLSTPYQPGSVLRRPGWPPIYLNPSLDAIGAHLVSLTEKEGSIWCPRPEGTDPLRSPLCRKLFDLLGSHIFFDPVLKPEILIIPEPSLPDHLVFSSPVGIRAFYAQVWAQGDWFFLPAWCVGHGTASFLTSHRGKIQIPEKEAGLNQFNIKEFSGDILQVTGEVTRRDLSTIYPDRVKRLILYRLISCKPVASKNPHFSAILCFSRQTLQHLIALKEDI